MGISSEQGNPARVIQSGSGPHDQVLATIKKLSFPLNNREFVGRFVCAKDTNGDLLITAVPVDDVIDYGMNTRTVRGVSRALTRFTPSGESQCKVTYIQYLDAGGLVPTHVVESKIPLALSSVGEMRDQFQRDDEIDKVKRDELARVIKEEPQVYSEDEDSLIQRVQDKFGALKEEDFEELESPDHLIKMGKTIEGDGLVVIRASANIDSSIEDCAAWEISKMSRELVKVVGSLERSLASINDHYGVIRMVYDFGIPGFQPREFLSSLVWRRQGDKLAVVYDDTEHADFPVSPSLVRGSTTIYYEYVRE